MNKLTFKDKSYDLDSEGFLSDFTQWDRDFPEAIAPQVKIVGGLSEKHWDVINYIRRVFDHEGRCPLIYEVCRAGNLNMHGFKKLFPAGYLRGACKLAGITYKEGFIGRSIEATSTQKVDIRSLDKLYQVDAFGFLANPYDWDRQFAELKAFELKMPEHLTEAHWHIIFYLREYFKNNYMVPNVFETCEANNLDIEDLERLFPDGYQRGAIKTAGLRVR